MKKIILTLFAAASIFAANAQEAKTMYVIKNGMVVFQSVVADIDSIVFYNPSLPTVDHYTVAKYGMDDRHELSYYVIDTGVEGLNVAVVGGIHGNEIAGWGAALDIVENFPFTKGKFLIIPKANKLACDLNDRHPGAKEPGYLPATLEYRNLDYTDMNRVFPGNPNGTMTEKIAAVITEILDAFEPELFFDLHESQRFHDDTGYTGNSLIVVPAYRSVNEAVVAAINASGLTPERNFVSLNAYTETMATVAYHKRYKIPAFLIETTRHEGLIYPQVIIPLERRISQHKFIINAAIDYYDK